MRVKRSIKENICGKPLVKCFEKKHVNTDKNSINDNFTENKLPAVIVLKFYINKFTETVDECINTGGNKNMVNPFRVNVPIYSNIFQYSTVNVKKYCKALTSTDFSPLFHFYTP